MSWFEKHTLLCYSIWNSQLPSSSHSHLHFSSPDCNHINWLDSLNKNDCERLERWTSSERFKMIFKTLKIPQSTVEHSTIHNQERIHLIRRAIRNHMATLNDLKDFIASRGKHAVSKIFHKCDLYERVARRKPFPRKVHLQSFRSLNKYPILLSDKTKVELYCPSPKQQKPHCEAWCWKHVVSHLQGLGNFKII